MRYISLDITLCLCIACLIAKDIAVKKLRYHLRQGHAANDKILLKIPENIKVTLHLNELLDKN